MACFHVTKHGFTTISSMLNDIVGVMTGNVSAQSGPRTNSTAYFNLEYSGVSPSYPSSVGVSILSSSTNVDPLANATTVGAHISNSQPGWRVCFHQIDNQRLAVHVGTDIQLANSGNIAKLNIRSANLALMTSAATSSTIAANVFTEPAGNLSSDWATSTPTAFGEIWLNRVPSMGSESAYPMSYALTITNRGIFLGVWEDSQEEIPQGTYDPAANLNPDGSYGNSPFKWFLVQRSVDRVTGHVRGGAKLRGDPSPLAETSRCPVFALTGTGSPPSYRKLIVREADVVSPSRKKLAAVNSEDNPSLINPWPQQSLTETGEFVVTFINNLTTPRYRYPDELDMLGTVSAEVVGAGTSILVNVYGEPYPREYTAVYANERFGTGMRLMILTKMGVDTTTNLDTYNVQVENSHVNYP